MNNEIPAELVAPIVHPATFIEQNNPDETFASRSGQSMPGTVFEVNNR
tara:strand:- start:10169 stop:10312 length:144 start_codon:yes stop_codon:yes gene_type:complete